MFWAVIKAINGAVSLMEALNIKDEVWTGFYTLKVMQCYWKGLQIFT